MTKEQREDLYIEWDLYDPTQQWKIIAEYFANGGACCQKNWENYLKDKVGLEDTGNRFDWCRVLKM
jgi:hypothetical protein